MARVQLCSQTVARLTIAAAICASLTNCRGSRARGEPSIEFTVVPTVGGGNPDRFENIEGRVRGALPGDRLVLFALSGVWWVQPRQNRPFTAIQPDSRWKNSTHPGSAYAALLVDGHYHPPLTVKSLPEKGGPVHAVAIVQGMAKGNPPMTVEFSGYKWEVSQNSGEPLRDKNLYARANVWTDKSGFLHLRASKQDNRWVNSEVKLARSLGYGSYRFVVRDVAHLEPAAVFAFFTWDELGPPRQMDIEISRWGEAKDKNAQFVIEPYLVPANTVRFTAPPGSLTYWMNWQSGRVLFRTTRGASLTKRSQTIAEHLFTSGIPSAGNERVHMILYVHTTRRGAPQHDFEVVIEKFEFLP